MDAQTLYTLGITLMLAGFLILTAALLLLLRSPATKGQQKTKGAGIIIIGPIPIAFGTDKQSVRTILLLSLTLTILLVIALIILNLLSR